MNTIICIFVHCCHKRFGSAISARGGMVDTLSSGGSAARCVGSSPSVRTGFSVPINRFFWAINSVGLECHLDKVEVTGSSPV